jgi:hypothetical protein
LGVEAIGLAVDSTCWDARLLGALGRRVAEQDDGPDELVRDLLRPSELEPELGLVIGRFNPLALAQWHGSPRHGTQVCVPASGLSV